MQLNDSSQEKISSSRLKEFFKGQSAYRVRAVWTDDDGLERNFFSPALMEDPSGLLQIGSSLHFRINQYNPSEYIIEPDQLAGITEV